MKYLFCKQKKNSFYIKVFSLILKIKFKLFQTLNLRFSPPEVTLKFNLYVCKIPPDALFRGALCYFLAGLSSLLMVLDLLEP